MPPLQRDRKSRLPMQTFCLFHKSWRLYHILSSSGKQVMLSICLHQEPWTDHEQRLTGQICQHRSGSKVPKYWDDWKKTLPGQQHQYPLFWFEQWRMRHISASSWLQGSMLLTSSCWLHNTWSSYVTTICLPWWIILMQIQQGNERTLSCYHLLLGIPASFWESWL